ncbi:MAG: hypothetical protein ACE5HV_10340 [Acidobacteriota bacterium]
MIDKQYVKSEVILIVILSAYCVALVIGALGYLFLEYANLQPSGGLNDSVLLRLVVAVGILGSIMRGASNLFDDVGRGRFDPRWSLSIIMRPVEGAALAVVTFFFFRSILLVLGLGTSTVNPMGFLAIAGLAGMFSHKAADGL